MIEDKPDILHKKKINIIEITKQFLNFFLTNFFLNFYQHFLFLFIFTELLNCLKKFSVNKKLKF